MRKEFLIMQRGVSYEQLMVFLRLIRALPSLYRLVPRRNRTLTLKRFWDVAATKLNAIKGGAFKSSFDWSQYLQYIRLRIKQRITEIVYERKITLVIEDDLIPVSEVDRLIMCYLNSEDDDDEINYIFDPTKSKFWEECTSKPAVVRKRRHSASDDVIVKRWKQSPTSSEETNDDAKALDDVCDKHPRNADSDNMEFEAPAILRRCHSFTDMSDAIEFDRKMKLEVQAERTKTDPESVEKREIEEIRNIRLISVTMRETLVDCMRIILVTNTFREILKNNPRFKNNISEMPTIF